MIQVVRGMVDEVDERTIMDIEAGVGMGMGVGMDPGRMSEDLG